MRKSCAHHILCLLSFVVELLPSKASAIFTSDWESPKVASCKTTPSYNDKGRQIDEAVGRAGRGRKCGRERGGNGRGRGVKSTVRQYMIKKLTLWF